MKILNSVEKTDAICTMSTTCHTYGSHTLPATPLPHPCTYLDHPLTYSPSRPLNMNSPHTTPHKHPHTTPHCSHHGQPSHSSHCSPQKAFTFTYTLPTLLHTPLHSPTHSPHCTHHRHSPLTLHTPQALRLHTSQALTGYREAGQGQSEASGRSLLLPV